MRRAALYARFSTDLQSERSVEDQLELCRGYSAREGLRVVSEHADRAKSGASMFGRDGLLRLMMAARERAFDVVVVEHSDRLSRSMKDLSSIHETLTFAGIEIRAVHSGRLDTASIGLYGLVGQLQREDGAKKVRRGLAGVVREGRYAGGRPYGYRVVPGSPGLLAIVDEEAAVVRRIFRDYSQGATPRDVAGRLNREGVAPPRGRHWNASTINGNAARGSGILHNEVYRGRLAWNKVRMVKDPETGRRVSRVNPQADRVVVEAPALRLVDDALWTQVQDRMAARTQMPSGLRRKPVHMLSGLVRCGCCGSGMSVHDRSKTGRVRLRCSTVRESGTCTNTARIGLDRLEAAVVDGMRSELADPRLIAVYVRAYNAERERLSTTARRDRGKIEARAAEAQRELDRTIDALIKGRLSDEEADARLPELRAARDHAAAELAVAGDAPKVISLHPAAIADYLAKVDSLAALLANPAAGDEALGRLVDQFRSLVDRVIVHPTGTGAFDVEVKGRLAELIGGTPFPEKVGVKLVAGARYTPKPHDEPLFRYRRAA